MSQRDMGLKSDVLEQLFDLPGSWNKKLGVLESPSSLFTCVAPLTVIPFTAEGRHRQRNGMRQWLEAWLF